MAVRLYWCEEHAATSYMAHKDIRGECWWQTIIGALSTDESVSPCRMSERLLVDPSSLPEHAVEAAALALFGLDDQTYNDMARAAARAAIRGFLESLSEEDK